MTDNDRKLHEELYDRMITKVDELYAEAFEIAIARQTCEGSLAVAKKKVSAARNMLRFAEYFRANSIEFDRIKKIGPAAVSG